MIDQNLLTVIGSVVSAMMGGGAITAALAKRHVNKTFAQIDQLTHNFGAMTTNLAVLSTKIESIDKLTNLVMEHALQIARLEAKLHVRNGSHHSDH